MLTNPKPKINQKNAFHSLASDVSDCSQLQHIRALMSLSRRRFSRDDVLRLIDRREIGWAWDISRRNARRPEVRIWRESLAAYLARENGEEPPPGGEWTVEQVIRAVLPKPDSLSTRAAVVRATELQRRFLCCRTHLTALIADGELCQTAPLHSPNPAILYQSIFEFLKRRCISL